MSVPTNIAMTWWFWPISKTASASNWRALCPESDKSIVFPLEVIKKAKHEDYWKWKYVCELGNAYFLKFGKYLWSWSVISLRIIRSPDVLRATAAFEMAVILPMTSAFQKDFKLWNNMCNNCEASINVYKQLFFLLPRKRSVLLAYCGSISIGFNENAYFGKVVSLLFSSKICVLMISFNM